MTLTRKGWRITKKKLTFVFVIVWIAVLLCACGVKNRSDDIVVCADAFDNCYAVSSDGKVFLYYCPKNENESFAVPEGVETVAEGAFDGAVNLKELTFASTVTEIGAIFDGAFLESVTIPETVTGYASEVLEIHSPSLRNLTVACDVGGVHLGGCENLESVTLRQAPAHWGGLMLDGCAKLTSITLLDAEPVRDEAFETYCAEKNGYPVLYIPEGAVSLGSELINATVNLYLPDSVETVDWSLYYQVEGWGTANRVSNLVVSMPSSAVIVNAPEDAETEILCVSDVFRREKQK